MGRFLWWAFYEHPLIATFASILIFFAILIAILRLWPVRKRKREPIAFHVFKEFEGNAKEALRSFSHWQRLAYALVVCRRFRPYYDAFASLTGFGDPAALDRVEQALMAALRGGETSPENIADIRRRTEQVVPNEEVFESFEDTPEHLLAQDAAVAHLSAISVLSRGADELDEAFWLASACYEAADRQAMDVALPLGGVITAAVEAEVESSVAVQSEVRWNKAVLADLRSSDESPATLEKLLVQYSREPLLRS